MPGFASALVRTSLDKNPLHLIQRHLIIAPVIQAGGARGFVIRHALRDLELTAVPEVLGDPGGTERVIADLRAGERAGGSPID